MSPPPVGRAAKARPWAGGPEIGVASVAASRLDDRRRRLRFTPVGRQALHVIGDLLRDPLLADDIGGRFDHILVDEYQGANRLQAETGGTGKASEPRYAISLDEIA